MNIEEVREYMRLIYETEISGAWHMNKKYWNQLNLLGKLSDEFVKHLIRHSYNEVVKKLSRKLKDEKEIKLLSE